MHNQAMNYYARDRPAPPPAQATRLPPRLTNKPAKPTGRRKESSGPGTPVDAADLTRRLQIVLAEQERQRALEVSRSAHVQPLRHHRPAPPPPHQPTVLHPLPDLAAKKSRAFLDRAAGTKLSTQALPDAHSGPYVPREAAAQFELTATAMNMRDDAEGNSNNVARRMSRNALRFQVDGDRNPPPRTGRISGEFSADSVDPHDTRHHRHSVIVGGLHSYTKDQQQQQQHEHKRRSSLGDVLLSVVGDMGSMRASRRGSHAIVSDSPGHPVDESPPSHHQQHKPLPLQIADHRVDWTQSDEVKKPGLLRRPVSIWALRGRRGSHSKQSRDDMASSSSESPELKSPRLGFFSRFKR